MKYEEALKKFPKTFFKILFLIGVVRDHRLLPDDVMVVVNVLLLVVVVVVVNVFLLVVVVWH